MATQSSVKDGVGTLSPKGRFDFSQLQDFIDAGNKLVADTSVRSLVIDMGQVEYLDSSALGMLLLIRERCQQAKGSVPAITNAKGVVKKVLDVANFQKLFAER